MKPIYILGAMPPPIGGVTIHVKRLLYYLKREYDSLSVQFIELRKSEILAKIKYYLSIFRLKNVIIHYQLNKWSECLIFDLLRNKRRTKMIMTVHSYRIEQLSFFDNFARSVLRKKNIYYIAPSSTIKESMIADGFNPDYIYIIRTYLAPIPNELNESVPSDISNFIEESKNGGGFICLGNAYKLYLDVYGKDVYGLDMCIEACRRIASMYLVYCIPQYDNGYLLECETRIKNYGISNRVLLYKGKISLPSLFRYVDVFVRPTTSDSYGISVEEAIDAGITSIASDVCERAKGAILFEAENIDDFVSKVKNYRTYKKTDVVSTNALEIIVDIYNELSNSLDKID